MFLSEKTPLVALDIGTSSIKMAQLGGKDHKYELLSFGVMPLQEECIVDGVIRRQEEVVEALERMIKAENIDTRYAVASISGEAVIVKKIRVPLMSEAELAETIYQEAEQYIPFDIDDVSIDFQLLGTDESLEEDGEKKMEVLLVAVQKDIIESRTEILYDAGLRPIIIDLDIFALTNAFSQGKNPERMGEVAIIDLGESFSHVHILKDGVSAYTRDVPFGGSLATKKLMQKFKLSYQQVAGVKAGNIPSEVESDEVIEIIVSSFEKILEEVQKAFEFFSTTSNSQVAQVYLSGGGALIPGVDGLFSHHLNTPVNILDPLEGIKINKRKFDQKTIDELAPISSVAIGLATRRFDYK